MFCYFLFENYNTVSKGLSNVLLKLFAGTFGCLYKGAVRGLFEDQPRKKVEVSIKALQGMLADEKKNG